MKYSNGGAFVSGSPSIRQPVEPSLLGVLKPLEPSSTFEKPTVQQLLDQQAFVASLLLLAQQIQGLATEPQSVRLRRQSSAHQRAEQPLSEQPLVSPVVPRKDQPWSYLRTFKRVSKAIIMAFIFYICIIGQPLRFAEYIWLSVVVVPGYYTMGYMHAAKCGWEDQSHDWLRCER